MIKKYIAILMATMSVSSVFAASIDFPVGQKNGSFNCTASDPNAFVSIDTYGLNAKGSCAGSPYVTRDGHLVGMPVSVLNDFYFEINKLVTRSGNIEIKVSSGNLTCSNGRGSRVTSYGAGKFCFSQLIDGYGG
jgi:hypothetical protein